MPSWIKYIIILVIFTITVYWLSSPSVIEEKFETNADGAGGTDGTDANGGTGGTGGGNEDAKTSTYIENLDSLPGISTLKYYLTSFSAGTKYDATFAPFRASETRWYDLFSNNISFTLIGTLPTMNILNTGLSMKGIKMIGPPSESIGGASSYELPAFTYMMYGKLNSLIFEDNRPITLFQIYAENPNHISLTITPKNTIMVKVELVLGFVNRIYQWDVPRSTLLSNGNKTLYSIVYEKLDNGNKAYFYIGDNQFSATIENPHAIKLGNSQIDINSDTTLDMTLWNLSLFTSALTREEMRRWNDYFSVQATGLASDLESTQSALNATVNDISNTLANQTQTLQEVQGQLDTCKAALPSPQSMLEKAKARWHLKLDEIIPNTVSGEESASCSILNIKGKGTGNAGTGTTGTTGTGGAAAGTTGTAAVASGASQIGATTANSGALASLLARFHIGYPAGTESAEPKATADKITSPTK